MNRNYVPSSKYEVFAISKRNVDVEGSINILRLN